MGADRGDDTGYLRDIIARVLGRMRDADAPELAWEPLERGVLAAQDGGQLTAWTLHLPVAAEELGAAARLVAVSVNDAAAVLLLVDNAIEAQLESPEDPNVKQLVAAVRMQVTAPQRTRMRRNISQAVDLL